MPTSRNPKFYFKANRIHEWVDLLIIAAGRAVHERMFQRFLEDIYNWINKLGTSDEDVWALPYSVMQIRSLEKSFCTPEAVLFETMIKQFLYDQSFYPKEKHSVKQIVIERGGYTEDELTLSAIIESCPTIFRTSSFDITKYEEV